ncbi:hypothetical protein L195_g024556 [Trifolium pratense]|uniref:Late embryogenesis abundant protein LEA-2 subgroup domain-containing protein n=1 Tax=Trifolium pratense TaxID=57577 RepID=A0A2K3NDZ6_TRIPR|nr:hypothetical protein L195_g024556 [Trifolium pratense]
MERLKVRKAKVRPLPPLSVDVSLSVTAKIHNKGLLWMNLAEVDIHVKYRGNKLGHVETESLHVNRWGLEHVYGEIEFSELPSSDVAHLMKELAKGSVLFHTSVRVTGHFGLFLFHFPNIFKIKVSCDVLVNSKNHTIVHQHCVEKIKIKVGSTNSTNAL